MSYGKIHSIKGGFAKRIANPSYTPAVIFDTNLLLYLITKDDYFDFLLKIDSMVSNNRLLLLIPEQVLNEFYNNVDVVVNRKKENIRRIINESKGLKDYFVNITPCKGEEFKKLLNELERNENKVFSRNLTRKVACIELLIRLRAIIIPTDERVKVEAANMALEKKAPFFGDKNNKDNKDFNKLSMGDAIIFLSSYYHLKKRNYKKVYFVTENAVDFCKAGNKNELHENIQDKAKEVSLTYEINIAKVINDIIELFLANVPEKKTLKPIEQAIVQKIEKEVTSDCPFCKDPKAVVFGSWRRGPLGITWHEQCNKCGSIWDSGEEFEC